jgi:Na+-translocating membrane potential-generating system MpsC-like protein
VAVPPDPLTGDALLDAVTDVMVALHERYYHRAPASSKTQLMGGEILACVMGGIYTDVEKTMIELERNSSVKATRSAFQHAMKDGPSPRSSACRAAVCTPSSPTATSGPTSRSSCSSSSPRPPARTRPTPREHGLRRPASHGDNRLDVGFGLRHAGTGVPGHPCNGGIA